MSLIIHKYLFEKLANHPEWARFKGTFETLSGCPLHLEETRPGGQGGDLAVKVDVRGVLVGVMVAEARGLGAAEEQACRHLLTLAAERFSSILAMSSSHDHEHLPPVVLKTTRWIRDRALNKEIRLGEAAASCGLSAGHLSRLFHQSTGLTFQEYVRRFRLERACELLSGTNQSITEIAFESGFQSISQFHRSFRAVYGRAPLKYRKENA
jgi:AraC-like DNA-binding protein